MDEKILVDYIEDNFDKQRKGKHFMLMLFETELELGISNTPNRWECCGYRYFSNGVEALNAYANTPNPASQLVDAMTKKELIANCLKMNEDMKDLNWLNKNLYPYL